MTLENSYLKLVTELLEDQYTPSENVLLSPWSVMSLLSVASDATGGKTREELLHLIGDKSIQLQRKAEDNCFRSASVVCVKPYIALKNEYLQQHREEAIRFEDLNEWVRRNTAGMIRELDPGTADACLLNAVVFESAWMEAIEEVQEMDFKNADGTATKVKMLRSTEDVYINTSEAEGFLKWYETGYKFLALLPKKAGQEGMKQFLNKHDFLSLFNQEERRYLYRVHAGIPEFTADSSTELRAFLEEQGIKRIFTNEADFSPMTTSSLQIERVVHKTHIEVDRNGTRAAGLTGGMALGCAESMKFEDREVVLNRPFVYAILDGNTNLPLFTGVMNHV